MKVKEYIQFFWKYLKTQKFTVFLLILVSGANIGMILVNPQIIRCFLDEAYSGNFGSKLVKMAGLFISISVLAQIFLVVSNYISEKMAWKATNNIRRDLMEHCIDLHIGFHKEHKAGELIERVDGDVSELFQLFSRIIMNIFTSVILLIGTLVVLYCENIIVGLALSIYAAIAIYVLWKVKGKTESHWVRASEANAKFYGFIGESVSNTEDIASSGAQKHIMKRFYDSIRERYPIIMKANLTWCTIWSSTVLIFAAGTVTALSVSVFLWKQNLMTVGTAYLIFKYTENLKRPIEQIRADIQELQVAGASIIRVNNLFKIKSKIKYGREKWGESGENGLEVKDLSFQYEEGKEVLEDISFNLERGKTLGVIGHTGSGKTTLASLIVRLYDTKKGEILIGNREISSISQEELTKNIAYVTQDVHIFTSTVRENITMFRNDMEDEKIIEIIIQLGFEKWYQGLKHGLDTYLEGGSMSISAGEAQIIAFIRIFLQNPRFVILDEATSKIDSLTEELFEGALDKLLKDRTCIIIAHRLSTLKRVDDILILENGKIVEKGDRNKLLNDSDSRFNKLLQHGISEVLV